MLLLYTRRNFKQEEEERTNRSGGGLNKKIELKKMRRGEFFFSLWMMKLPESMLTIGLRTSSS
jgi:hypothetical protein